MFGKILLHVACQVALFGYLNGFAIYSNVSETELATIQITTPKSFGLNSEQPSIQYKDENLKSSTLPSYSSSPSSVAEMKKDPKSEVEDIQMSDKIASDPDVNLEEQFMLHHDPVVIDFEDNTVVDHPHLKHRDIAIISAAVLAVLCLFSYLGLVYWRKSLEKRYGGLERLITEDDFTLDDSDLQVKGLER